MAESAAAGPAGEVSATFSAAEVREHNTKDSVWVVLHGQVYDLTNFVEAHPGGAVPILASAGTDVTVFWSAFHKMEWLESHLQPEWRLGTFDGAEMLQEYTAAAPAAAKEGSGGTGEEYTVHLLNTEDPQSLKKRQYRNRPIDKGITFQIVDTIILLESSPGRKGVLMDRIVNLVKTRGDPNCSDQDSGGGSTPLMIAAMIGSDEQVRTLLESDADPLYTTDRGVSVLHKFAARPMPDAHAPAVLARLLEAACSANVTMKQGRTPLHVAAQWGQAEMCRLLLDRGAMPRARAGADGTPADWARATVLNKAKLASVLRVLPMS